MILRSRFLLGPGGLLREGEALRIDGGRIVERGRSPAPRAGEETRDLGDALLLPAWINAHAHLELSGLGGSLPRGQGFVPWVEALVRERAGRDKGFFREGVLQGGRLAREAGTAALADVTTTSATRSALEDAPGEMPPEMLVFEEVIAPDPAGMGEALDRLRERIDRFKRSGERAGTAGPRPAGPRPVGPRPMGPRPGVAPHAPTTVSPALLRELGRFAARRGLPLSIHASETEEEVRMLSRGDGALVGFLRSLGALPGGWSPPGCRPIPYLDGLGLLGPGTLLVHANYLDEGDLARIAASGTVVVYCPRSHRFFGHREHPLPRLLAAGVPVALGTDSLASNDSLSMLEEVREAARAHPGIRPEALLEAALEGGARALGIAGEAGRLEPGFRADLVAYHVTEGASARDALAEVIEGGEEPAPALLPAGGAP